MLLPKRPSVGLAMSGSGNRTTFYIGLLEGLEAAGVPLDYLAACSGGSLIAAAYACGRLEELKQLALTLDSKHIKAYVTESKEKSGLYSLEPAEAYLRELTEGKTFDEVRPRMAFVAVDIENGEQIILCMGEIARAARVSCTLPGIFEPVKWGNRTLVDGGLLSVVPTDVLQNAGIDVTIGVNLRGTRHVFSEQQLELRGMYRYLKKILFFEELESIFKRLLRKAEENPLDPPGIMSVIGKSLDVAIKANRENNPPAPCDYMIVPDLPRFKRLGFTPESMRFYYEQGLTVAQEHAPKILEIIEKKRKQMLL